MTRGTLFLRIAVIASIATSLSVLTSCKRSDGRGGGEPITGRASDPPVTFTARWDETNHFVYHLESITGTQVPRRNSDVVIQQDTVLAKDLRFGVTNVTPEGFRSMQMEIQAVRVETTSDQRLTSAFDTENELLSTEDNTIASRLRRVKGAKLGFRLSPANRILRTEGSKEFNDQVGMSRSVRGAAGAVLNKFFNQQFYRDLVEISFLPTNAVRIGDSWTIRQRSWPGLYNNSGVDLTFTFRGWQDHEGTNCARFDFIGGSKPGTAPVPNPGRTSSSETGEIEGTVWFSQDMGVPVELLWNQSIDRHSTSTRVVRPPGSTNGGPVVSRTIVVTGGALSGGGSTNAPTDVVVDTDDAPEPPGSVTNAPQGTVTTTSRTTTTKQHVVMTLIEVIPVTPPAPAK